MLNWLRPLINAAAGGDASAQTALDAATQDAAQAAQDASVDNSTPPATGAQPGGTNAPASNPPADAATAAPSARPGTAGVGNLPRTTPGSWEFAQQTMRKPHRSPDELAAFVKDIHDGKYDHLEKTHRAESIAMNWQR